MRSPIEFYRQWQQVRADRRYAMLLSGQTPIFSQFGEDVYVSDMVRWCVGYIATEISKLTPRHIRTDENGQQEIVKGPINRMLKIAPNPLMTISEYLEKTTWQLYRNDNCFIFPDYEIYINNHGQVKKKYKALWPLAPTQVDFVYGQDDVLCVEMRFGNGQKYTLEYGNLIHLRRNFSSNEFMGGDRQGRADIGPLLTTLQLNHEVTQTLPMALKTSLGARMVVQMKLALNNEKRQAELDRFRESLENARGGLLVTDIMENMKPLNINPKLLDKETMSFLEQKIFRWYGVSLPVISGEFTDEDYQAVYEKTLEPLILREGQAYSKTLFTEGELERNNEIAFYPQALLYSSTKNKIAVADILGGRGALTDNQMLALFGYPPFPGGDQRQKSLNFINRDLADEYQLSMAQRNRKGGNMIADIQENGASKDDTAGNQQ